MFLNEMVVNIVFFINMYFEYKLICLVLYLYFFNERILKEKRDYIFRNV